MEKLNTILNTNTSDSEFKNTNTKTLVLSLHQVQQIANKLEEKLGKQTPSRYPLYCKIARELPEHRIWYNLDVVLDARDKGKAHNPHGLFTYLCTQEIR